MGHFPLAVGQKRRRACRKLSNIHAHRQEEIGLAHSICNGVPVDTWVYRRRIPMWPGVVKIAQNTFLLSRVSRDSRRTVQIPDDARRLLPRASQLLVCTLPERIQSLGRIPLYVENWCYYSHVHAHLRSDSTHLQTRQSEYCHDFHPVSIGLVPAMMSSPSHRRLVPQQSSSRAQHAAFAKQ
jgi:hypothetical protein